MIVERFSQNVINSGIFRLFIATGFFATLIFFVINADYYTPMEMIFGVMGVTVMLKGMSNIMLGFIIALFNLDNKIDEFDYRYNSEKIDVLLSELATREAQLKAVEDAQNK
jgi:hypothetical protein